MTQHNQAILWQACDAVKAEAEALGLNVAGRSDGGDLVTLTLSRQASPLSVPRSGDLELWPGREDMMRSAYQLNRWATEKVNAINLAIEWEIQFALEGDAPI